MAVGKGSMERASKAVAAPKAEPEKAAEAKKAAPKKSAPKKSAAVKDTAVIASTNEQVMEKIVYQSSSQMLERDAEPNESFYLGDDMPVYFF